MTVEHNYCHGVKELVSNNSILAAVHEGTVSGNETTNRTATATQKTVVDYGAMNAETTNRTSTATQKAGYDGVVSVIDNVNRGTISTTKAVTDFQASAALTSAEARIEGLIASGVTNNLVAEGSKDGALAAKDIQIAIYKDGAHGRERSDSQFAALALQASKDTAAIQLQAANDRSAIMLQSEKNTAAILQEVKEICCCVGDKVKEDGEKTRGIMVFENTRRLEAALVEANTKNAINDAVNRNHHSK